MIIKGIVSGSNLKMKIGYFVMKIRLGYLNLKRLWLGRLSIYGGKLIIQAMKCL